MLWLRICCLGWLQSELYADCTEWTLRTFSENIPGFLGYQLPVTVRLFVINPYFEVSIEDCC